MVMTALAVSAHLAPLQGEAAQGARPPFEVASIKQSTLPDAAGNFAFSPDGLTISNYSLQRLISSAYGVMEYQIMGATSWMKTDRFDVIAKADSGSRPTRQDLNLMLQSLLAERFNLQLRQETQSGPTFALVVARSDGTLGEHLRRSTVDCQVAAAPVRSDPEKCVTQYGFETMHMRGAFLQLLVINLKSVVQRPVIDRTGLTGGYDYDLQWNRSGSADSQLPSIFSALQEQLGLKLVSEQGPVETLVIEHADHPTPN